MLQCIVVKLEEVSCDADLANATEERHIRKFATELHEPDRTIFQARLDGMSPSKISEKVGLSSDAVRRTLAKLYASLRLSGLAE